jgi:hypothetical protein
MARNMINETNIAKHFWAEAINTACYIHNRISIRPILNKTPYELWKNSKPNISYFHPFGCTCYILNTKEYLNKFVLEQSESDNSFLVEMNFDDSKVLKLQLVLLIIVLVYRITSLN